MYIYIHVYMYNIYKYKCICIYIGNTRCNREAGPGTGIGATPTSYLLCNCRLSFGLLCGGEEVAGHSALASSQRMRECSTPS